jgi:hypothetical protein
MLGVVLDHDDCAAGTEMCGKPADDLGLSIARHEMEAVGSDQAMQKRQIQLCREVADQRSERDAGKPRCHGRRVLRERYSVAVHRDDPSAWANQLGERKRERTRARADVGPCLAGCYRGTEQGHVVGVIHP